MHSHLKAVPEVNVQDLSAQPVQHQVGRVPETSEGRRGKKAALIMSSSRMFPARGWQRPALP